MQRVERKRHRERKHRRLWWMTGATLALALSLGLVFVLRAQENQEPVPSRVDTSGILLNTDPANVMRVTITLRGQAPWTMERTEEGEYLLAGETDWQVSDRLAERITESLAYLEYEDILTEDPGDWQEDRADFGLADPRVRVEAELRPSEEQEKTELTLLIGDAIEAEENSVFYLEIPGDDRLYALASGTVQDLMTEREQLHPVEQPELHEALLDRMTVRDGNGSIQKEWALRGNLTDQDAGTNWMVTEPFQYPMDEETLSNMKSAVGSLRLGLYIGEATAENLERTGLTRPQTILELHFGAGSTGTVSDLGVYDVQDWAAETVTFALGEPRSDLTVYAQFEDAIYSMTRFQLEALTEAVPLQTVARYPVLTPFDSLSELTLWTEGGEETVYTLDRETDAETEESRMVCWKNGEEIPYDAFSAAYDRLLVITFSGMLPEGADWGEPHTRYTFRAASGNTHTVELSNFDGLHDAVTVDGCTMFYLIKGGMTELP